MDHRTPRLCRLRSNRHGFGRDGGQPRASLDARAREIRPLLFADTNALLRPGGLLEPVDEWATAFRDAGKALGHAVQDGTLDRGLRQVLSYHVIFHWNRLGLSMRGQSILAWAARAAILHGENGA
ncbi:thiopeptide-type bacteriocin biosynthesis protein [Streptomyces sp. NPDC088727]|uniref:thiopeptide-type bacteriocin biosynthesis protein n=1 Tax=Streptomyces sp. NPDC088727 TaxID=3365875 RepID=UPI00382266F3